MNPCVLLIPRRPSKAPMLTRLAETKSVDLQFYEILTNFPTIILIIKASAVYKESLVHILVISWYH